MPFEELESISSRLPRTRASLGCGTVLRQVFHCHLLSFGWRFSFYDYGSRLALDAVKQFGAIDSRHRL